MAVTNPGDKEVVKTVTQTQEIIVGGDTVSEVVEVGAVMRGIPGPRVTGPEYIMLVTEEGAFMWNAPLEDYDPGTVDDEPANEARWVAL